jgi:DNA excision repair protein ERCC-2
MDNGTFTDDDVINVFKTLRDYDRTAVILGVQGGTLSEGVDYRAEQMEMVIILGLPYPASAAERRLNQIRQDYFFMQGMNRQAAEDLAYKQEAFRKVAQSIGRSHRSMTDRAVVILADERLLSIKKVQEDLPNRYEFLSPQNAKKNLELLQRPVQKLKKNLVIGGDDKNENRILADYISTGLGVTRKDFVNFKHMGEKIREFYK